MDEDFPANMVVATIDFIDADENLGDTFAYSLGLELVRIRIKVLEL